MLTPPARNCGKLHKLKACRRLATDNLLLGMGGEWMPGKVREEDEQFVKILQS